MRDLAVGRRPKRYRSFSNFRRSLIVQSNPPDRLLALVLADEGGTIGANWLG